MPNLTPALPSLTVFLPLLPPLLTPLSPLMTYRASHCNPNTLYTPPPSFVCVSLSHTVSVSLCLCPISLSHCYRTFYPLLRRVHTRIGTPNTPSSSWPISFPPSVARSQSRVAQCRSHYSPRLSCLSRLSRLCFHLLVSLSLYEYHCRPVCSSFLALSYFALSSLYHQLTSPLLPTTPTPYTPPSYAQAIARLTIDTDHRQPLFTFYKDSSYCPSHPHNIP